MAAYAAYLAALIAAVVIALMAGAVSHSPAALALVASASTLVILAVAYVFLDTYVIDGGRWALYAGAGLLLAIAPTMSLVLPSFFITARPPGALAYAWSIEDALAAGCLLLASFSRGVTLPSRRPVALTGALAAVLAGAGVAAVVGYAINAPSGSPAPRATVELVSAAVLFIAAIGFVRRVPRSASAWLVWLGLSLPLLAAADVLAAANPAVSGQIDTAEIFRSLFTLALLAGLVATAGRAFARLSRQTVELEALDQLVRVPAIQDTSAVVENIIDVVSRTMQARARILLTDDGRTARDALAGQLIRLDADLSADTQPRVLVGFEETSDSGQVAMGISLRAGDRRLGVLAVTRQGRNQFTRPEAAILRALAAHAAMMLERSFLYEEVEAGAILQERSRLAREIHDGLAQHLAFLKMRVAWLRRAPSVERSQLEDIEGVLETALVEARHAITTLRTSLDASATVQAMIDYAQEFGEVSGLEVLVERSDPVPELSPKARVELLRIVQEALNNVRKHASAGAVRIAVAGAGGWLEVTIVDDGAGFVPQPGAAGHFGLEIMRERAVSVGGELDVYSGDQSGTRVRIRLPVTETGLPAPQPLSLAEG
ncbi:MAG: sensor histidine kinase [Chloroflexota bacterium]